MLNLNKCLFSLALLLCSVSVQAYQISTCAELQNITDMMGHYTIINELDCSGSFEPIRGPFLGSLDGQGNRITHLTINGGGLFTQIGTPDNIYRPVVKNINFEDVKVNGVDDRGLLSAQAFYTDVSDITVYNLYVGAPKDKHNTLSGGLLGFAQGVNISNVHLSGDLGTGVMLKVRRLGGGLVAQAGWGTSIINSSVKLLNSEGHCLEDKTYCAIGGLVGLVDASDGAPVTITQSSAHGKLQGKHNVGGLVGLIKIGAPVAITHSYAMVDIYNEHYAGGLIGQAPGNNHNGAKQDVILNNVYATGEIEIAGDEGGRGIIGNEKKSSVRVLAQESYFDSEATGKKYPGDNQSVGLNTRSMQHPDTFSAEAGWDRTIWDVVAGHYPALIKPVE